MKSIFHELLFGDKTPKLGNDAVLPGNGELTIPKGTPIEVVSIGVLSGKICFFVDVYPNTTLQCSFPVYSKDIDIYVKPDRVRGIQEFICFLTNRNVSCF